MSSARNARQKTNTRTPLTPGEVSMLQREMVETDVSHAANVIKEMLRYKKTKAGNMSADSHLILTLVIHPSRPPIIRVSSSDDPKDLRSQLLEMQAKLEVRTCATHTMSSASSLIIRASKC